MILDGLIIARQQSALPPYRPMSTLRIFQDEKVLPMGKRFKVSLEDT
jgi:hypothetical protein